jgi:uncharacterized lipoprotein YddW (UPF0748 family)
MQNSNLDFMISNRPRISRIWLAVSLFVAGGLLATASSMAASPAAGPGPGTATGAGAVAEAGPGSETGPGLRQTGTYAEEVRGVWITNVDSDVMFDRRKLEQAMDYLAEQGINVVFPVVWNRGFTLHPSAVMDSIFGVPQSSVFRNQDRDPLREVITEGHRAGMEVIPWFEYGFAGAFGGSNFIFQQKPEWAARNSEGRIASRNGFLWLNGFDPEVQEFMLSLIREVMENYDIDGVQGDDRLPALPNNAGYDDYTVQRYKDEHDGAEPPGESNAAFIQWRSDILTAFGGDLYEMVKEYDDNLIVSLSPSIWPWSRDNYLQDWPAWLEAGQVDIIHPQAYRYDLDGYQLLIRQMLGARPGSTSGYFPLEHRHRLSPGVLSGVGGNLNPPSMLIDKVAYNREFGVNGEVYFFYETLRERNDHALDSIAAIFYQEPATMPGREGMFRRVPGMVSHNDDPVHQFSGSWSFDEASEGSQMGSHYAAAGTDASVVYRFEVPADAHYRVYAYIPYGIDGNASVNLTVQGSSGDPQAATLDQSAGNLHKRGWTPVGQVYLEQGVQTVVQLDAAASGGDKPVYADAVMLILNRKLSPDVVLARDVRAGDEPASTQLPDRVHLQQNYPNPFNPSTTIRFELPGSDVVTLEVFDLLGRSVATLVDSQQYTAGSHSVVFDAGALASGVYIYRLHTGAGVVSKTMSLVK